MTTWQHTTNPSTLEKDEVHIWRANLDVSETQIIEYAKCLSADEITRSNKFRFAVHKNRFIVARSILRQLLAVYLNISAESIIFDYGERGKPQIAKLNNCNDMEFNLSHSQDYALYGFTRNYSIGVDLEYLREMPDAVKIARRFFSPREFQLIANLQGKQQQEVFFKLWTAKEAYLKAIGAGLAGSLATVDITLDSSKKVQLLAIDGNSNVVKDWFLYSCIPGVNYIATIAIHNSLSDRQLRFWDWNKSLNIKI